MSTIRKAPHLMTLINVFTVEPAKQERLIELLVSATEKTMRRLPGFVSANIHRSVDGTKVINYAQWSSPEAFDAMRRNPDATPHMEAAGKLASSVEPIVCVVSESIAGAPLEPPTVHHQGTGIDVHDERQVKIWMELLDATREDLVAAVGKVGPEASRIRAYFGEHRKHW